MALHKGLAELPSTETDECTVRGVSIEKCTGKEIIFDKV